MSVEVGAPAPDFVLPDQHGRTVRLSGYRGRAAVLVVFYPFAFTGVCTGELRAIRDGLPELAAGDVEVLAVSCDSMHSQRAFDEQERFGFPLLSDFWPHGAAARSYGVFLEGRGFATRGTFLVDREGVLRWLVVNGPGEARDVEDYRAALAALPGPPA